MRPGGKVAALFEQSQRTHGSPRLVMALRRSGEVSDGVNLVYFPIACRAGSTARIHQDAELIRAAGD